MTATGAVRCFGDDTCGQASVPGDVGPAKWVAAGHLHTCVVTAASAVRCFGDDRYGQVSKVPHGIKAASVAAGGWHSCARTAMGTLACWGSDVHGQSSFRFAGYISEVTAGDYHTCALVLAPSGGRAVCFGSDAFGQIGATEPGGYPGVSLVSASGNVTCVLTSQDRGSEARCFGDTTWGQAAPPGPAELGNSTMAVAAWPSHGCLVVDDTDECLDGTHGCHPRADCRNTAGGYECACRHGWTGDGFRCAPELAVGPKSYVENSKWSWRGPSMDDRAIGQV